MSFDCRRTLQACVDMSGLDDPGRLRSAFTQCMAEILAANTVLVFGLNRTRDHLVPLETWPHRFEVPSFNIFDAQRRGHPIAIATDLQGVLIEGQSGRSILADLRGTLFPEHTNGQLIIVPGFGGKADFPELLFCVVVEATGIVPAQTRELAQLFAQFSVHLNHLVSNLQAATRINSDLSRSFSQADKDRSSMRRRLPNALSGRLVGQSSSMQRLRETIANYGPSELSVLILGETGTGKELVARELHRLSERHDGPFVALNVAALPDDLAESELFGHVKGGFTGATRDRPGHIAAAHGGTLFLDEIGDMPLILQAKLLRVLQEKRFRAVGSDREQQSDFRLISATHRDLAQLRREERFRDDLYYRIGTTRIDLPALRDREGDVLHLCEHFLEQLATREGLGAKSLSPQAAAFLIGHPFPGNVRELQSMMARAFVLAGDSAQIEPRHFDIEESLGAGETGTVNDAKPDDGFRTVIEATEKRLLTRSLVATAGNRIRMARELRLPVSTLVDKLRKYGIGQGDERS